jgi:hypothetical protein
MASTLLTQVVEGKMKSLLNNKKTLSTFGVLATVGSIAILTLTGCAIEDTAGQNSAAGVESNLGTSQAALGVCPATPQLALERQQKASEILAYLLGNNSKLRDDGTSATFWTRSKADWVRWDLAEKDSSNRPYFLMSTQPSAPICGLTSSMVRFSVNPYLASLDRTLAKSNLSHDLSDLARDAETYYPGITPFLHTTTCGDVGPCYFDFDPEPAQLGAPLSGSTGASASGTYVNSGLAVRGVKWPSSPVNCTTNCPVGGQPCAPYTLNVGQLTTGFIANTASSYKCVAAP